MNYYDILGISSTATQEEIRENYVNLIKAFHPDSYSGPKDFAKRKSAELNEAYDVLKDENKRAIYDNALLEFQLDEDDLGGDSADDDGDEEESKAQYERAYSNARKEMDAVKDLKAMKKKARKRGFYIFLLILIIIGIIALAYTMVQSRNAKIKETEEQVTQATELMMPYKYASEWYLDNAVFTKTNDTKYYHRRGCDKLGGSAQYGILDVSAAKRQGLTACPDCFEEETDEYITKNFTTGGSNQ